MRRSLAALLVVVALGTRAAPARAEDEAVSWQDAAKHVGETITVEGVVRDVHCAPLSCLFAFEPTFKKFTAVIGASHFKAFPPPDELRALYEGRRVRVRGTVRLLDGKPEIPLESPKDIALAPPTDEEKQRADEDAERAHTELLARQTEVLEQLNETLQGLQDVVDRLAAAQERTEEVLVRLDEQIALLAAAQGATTPVYGPPAPPAYQAVRSVKRGMSQQDVVRLVGQPAEVQRWDGGEIWLFDYGRSVTFNSRGRVESLVGFN